MGIDHILLLSCIFINPVASAVLISSNPTNLVLSGAFSISFVTYTSSVALPFLTAALIVYLYLFVVLFRSVEYIPRNIELSGGGIGDDGVGIDRPSTALIDKSGAILGSILLMVTLGALTGTSTVGVPVWQVAVPTATMMLWRDLWRDWGCHRAERVRAKEQAGEQSGVSSSTGNAHPEIELQDLPLSASHSNSLSPVRHSRHQLALSTTLSTWGHKFVQIFPTVHAIYRQLPLSLVPFAFLMFILVQGLASQGWVHVFACWWVVWVNKTGVVGAVGGMMIGSGLLCNVCHLVSCVCNHHVTLDMWHEHRHDHPSSADATGMGVCQAARGLARPVCVRVRTCARVELWGVHFRVFGVVGRDVVAGHAAKERHPRSAISIRKVEFGHIYGGKRGIWSGVDRTDVNSP